jgi:hypothetical protein
MKTMTTATSIRPEEPSSTVPKIHLGFRRRKAAFQINRPTDATNDPNTSAMKSHASAGQ